MVLHEFADDLADLRDRHLLDQMLPQDDDLLLSALAGGPRLPCGWDESTTPGRDGEEANPGFFHRRERRERGEKQAALLKKKQLGVLGVPRGESLLPPVPAFARTQPGYAVASPVSGS